MYTRDKKNKAAYSLGRLTGTKIIPITPVVNFPYLDESNPKDREEALKMGLSLLLRCDELWCAGGKHRPLTDINKKTRTIY